MAVYIKPIPTLTGKVAEKFEKIARENEKKRGTVDFSREVEMTKRILGKNQTFVNSNSGYIYRR